MKNRTDDTSFLDRHPRARPTILWILALVGAALLVYAAAMAPLASPAETHPTPSGGAVYDPPPSGGMVAPQPKVRCKHRATHTPVHGSAVAHLHAESRLTVTGGPVRPVQRIYLARTPRGRPLDLNSIPSTSVRRQTKTTVVTTYALDVRSRALRKALRHRPLYIVFRATAWDIDGRKACRSRRIHKLRAG